MKFTKPISREVDIDGNTFIVSFDDNGIDFRVKGKRKTAHTDWNRVLEIARGEDGTSAHEILGVSAHQPASEEPESQEQRFAPQTAGFGQAQEANSPSLQENDSTRPQASEKTEPYTDASVSEYSQEERTPQASSTTEPQSNADEDDKREEFGRAVTAGEAGQES
jgi:hypothetical protein